MHACIHESVYHDRACMTFDLALLLRTCIIIYLSIILYVFQHTWALTCGCEDNACGFNHTHQPYSSQFSYIKTHNYYYVHDIIIKQRFLRVTYISSITFSLSIQNFLLYIQYSLMYINASIIDAIATYIYIPNNNIHSYK